MSIHTVDHLYQTSIPPGYDGPATSMFKMRGDVLLHYINCISTTCGACNGGHLICQVPVGYPGGNPVRQAESDI